VVTTTYAVRGMTCGHCAAAVTEEVTRIAGVKDVQVDLSAGRVTVSSEEALDQAQMSAAVDEAGYELVEA
jgi:copper ion binding protein